MSRTLHGRRFVCRIVAAAASLLMACSFFDRGADDDADEGTGTTGSDDGADTSPLPGEGFRVFPRYRLHDVPAVVTVEVEQMPKGCPADAVDGGYLCDTSEIGDDSVTINVKHDGFDPAVRHPMISPGQLVPLDVHLAAAGGPAGTWSDCVAAGSVEDCHEVCQLAEGQCVAASCATDDPEWPLATHETFDDADCASTPLDSLAAACGEPLPAETDVVALRCCCET
jgi:hypothetical protein